MLHKQEHCHIGDCPCDFEFSKGCTVGWVFSHCTQIRKVRGAAVAASGGAAALLLMVLPLP